MSSRSKLSSVVALCLALLIPAATENNAQGTSQQRTVKSFISQNKQGSNQCPSTEEWERGAKETKQRLRLLLTEYLSDRQSQTTTSSTSISTVTQSPTEVESTQSTESPTAGQTTEQSTEPPTAGQTTEQNTESPTAGQTTVQITESPKLGQTTEQSTESPTTGQATEQNMPTITDPLYTCNGTPGWRQVVFINMTDTSYNCPPGLTLTSYSKRTCGRAHTQVGCSSTTLSVGGSEYSRVCGRIRGYQVGVTRAFSGHLLYSQSIDGWYVDGVSLTHGPAGRRQHIWSFAGGLTEVDSQYAQTLCPCDTSDAAVVSPPYVGNDYFCESGIHSAWSFNYYDVIFPDDPLWDGQNCTSTSTCCQFNNPPWFTKTLPNPTTDNIELRICSFTTADKGDCPLEIIELYVK